VVCMTDAEWLPNTDAAVKQYETLKKLQPDIYNFGVSELNGLGRYLGRPCDPNLLEADILGA
jgi:hypothetical protein